VARAPKKPSSAPSPAEVHPTRVFGFDDVRGYLKGVLSERGSQRGLQSRLAEAAGCSASFLSQALAGKVQFTPEHVHGMAMWLRLPEAELAFLVLLVERERAGSQGYVRWLDARIVAARRQDADLAERLPKGRIEDHVHEVSYYSSWVNAAVHVALSIPELRSAPALAARLRLPQSHVEATLVSLEHMGLARREDRENWTLTSRFLHLPRQSPLARVNHAGWRAKAVEAIHSGRDAPIQYTSVFSLARSDIARLEEMVRTFVEETRAVIAESPEEEVVCFLVDLFPV
jgi:uncharacterized protein (TIGR02147 family)